MTHRGQDGRRSPPRRSTRRLRHDAERPLATWANDERDLDGRASNLRRPWMWPLPARPWPGDPIRPTLRRRSPISQRQPSPSDVTDAGAIGRPVPRRRHETSGLPRRWSSQTPGRCPRRPRDQKRHLLASRLAAASVGLSLIGTAWAFPRRDLPMDPTIGDDYDEAMTPRRVSLVFAPRLVSREYHRIRVGRRAWLSHTDMSICGIPPNDGR